MDLKGSILSSTEKTKVQRGYQGLLSFLKLQRSKVAKQGPQFVSSLWNFSPHIVSSGILG